MNESAIGDLISATVSFDESGAYPAMIRAGITGDDVAPRFARDAVARLVAATNAPSGADFGMPGEKLAFRWAGESAVEIITDADAGDGVRDHVIATVTPDDAGMYRLGEHVSGWAVAD